MKTWKLFSFVAILAIIGIIVGFTACDDGNGKTDDNDGTTKFEGTWQSPFNDYNSHYIFNKNSVIYNYSESIKSLMGTFTFTENTLEINFTHNWDSTNDQWSERSEQILALIQYNNFKVKDSFVVVSVTQNGSENTNFLGTWRYADGNSE